MQNKKENKRDKIIIITKGEPFFFLFSFLSFLANQDSIAGSVDNIIITNDIHKA